MLVAALISSKGAPRALVRSWLEGVFELIVCPALLHEFEHVLLRPKFRRCVTAGEVGAFVIVIRQLAELHANPTVAAGLTPDSKDDYLVALARASAAHFLISGNPHLYELKAPEPPVLTPRAFLEMIERP